VTQRGRTEKVNKVEKKYLHEGVAIDICSQVKSIPFLKSGTFVHQKRHDAIENVDIIETTINSVGDTL